MLPASVKAFSSQPSEPGALQVEIRLLLEGMGQKQDIGFAEELASQAQDSRLSI